MSKLQKLSAEHEARANTLHIILPTFPALVLSLTQSVCLFLFFLSLSAVLFSCYCFSLCRWACIEIPQAVGRTWSPSKHFACHIPRMQTKCGERNHRTVCWMDGWTDGWTDGWSDWWMDAMIDWLKGMRWNDDPRLFLFFFLTFFLSVSLIPRMQALYTGWMHG